MKNRLRGAFVASTALGVHAPVAAQAAPAQVDSTQAQTAEAQTAPAQQVQTARPSLMDSWTSDLITVRAGDIVTILIDELTLASADRDEVAQRERDRTVGVGAGTGTRSFDGRLRTQNDVSDRTRGGSTRREQFAAEISAVVVEILPNGIARIEGRKRLQIDDHEQEVTVRGIVRTQDISSANTVESWRVANAELLYDSNDQLGKTGGIWSTLLNLLIP